MKKIGSFQITRMILSGFKSFQEATTLTFGPVTLVSGGNGRGKTSIADAIAFAVTGVPFFGRRDIDRLHNESNADLAVQMDFIDGTGASHTLTRQRRRDRMTITYDGYEIRQLDLTDMFGERDVFLSVLNPLYFIEKLGESGKNLLERYLPTIPHEAVLAQLSEDTREALKDESILSPEIYLKNRREEIHNLRENILYLAGQKDYASTQNKDQEQRAQELGQRHDDLRRELSLLEEKRFAGMDIAAMQERLADLSARYEELAGSSGSNENQVQAAALREKIARRKAEEYQSKYLKPLAEAQAKLDELTARYKREANAYLHLVPGSACPTCHRPVTEENLGEVQAAIKNAAASIAEEGKQRKAEISELMELDAKSWETFERFRTEDLEKWEAEAADLEKKCQEAAGSAAGDAERLHREIQSLTAELEYGTLSQQEYDRMGECREELRQCEADLKAVRSLSQQQVPDFERQIQEAEEQVKNLERKISEAILYISKRAEMTFSSLKMNRVAISLYDVVKSTGEVKDAFKFTFGGRSYDRLSLSEKIRAGMEVSELLKRLTGRNYPVFVDNMESVDDLANVRPTGQVIMARCVSGAELSVRPVFPQQSAQAA